MKSFPWKCPTCHVRAVNPSTLPSYSDDLEHDGRKYLVTVLDLKVLQCEHCREIILDDDAQDRLTDALRAEAGLLKPGEILKKREDLKLTQRHLASLIGVSEASICRWETGAQIQQRVMDKFLRGFFEVPELRRFLGAPVSTWSSYSSWLPVSGMGQFTLATEPSITATLWSREGSWSFDQKVPSATQVVQFASTDAKDPNKIAA